MLQVRRSSERGHADHGWLNSYHTFSFADYYDPGFMGFRDLRVINEDWVAGGKGFPTHPHQDMEIITYVIEGALEHRDTLGTHSVIRPGEVQRMTAGTGIQHSEFNADREQRTHLLQIWILPDRRGHKPGYEQKSFSAKIAREPFALVAAKDGRDGAVSLNQDVDLYCAKWDSPRSASFNFRDRERYGWLQMVSGEVEVAGQTLTSGDALALAKTPTIDVSTKSQAEFLLFDLI